MSKSNMVYIEGVEAYVPRRIVESLVMYSDQRIRTGGFMEAVMANDLIRALQTADYQNRHLLLPIALMVHNFLPSVAIGSYEKIEKWLDDPGEYMQQPATETLRRAIARDDAGGPSDEYIEEQVGEQLRRAKTITDALNKVLDRIE